MVRDDDMLVYIWNSIYIVKHTLQDATLPYLEKWLGEVLGQFTKTSCITCRNDYCFHVKMGMGYGLEVRGSFSRGGRCREYILCNERRRGMCHNDWL